MKPVMLDRDTALIPIRLASAYRVGDGVRVVKRGQPEWADWQPFMEEAMKSLTIDSGGASGVIDLWKSDGPASGDRAHVAYTRTSRSGKVEQIKEKQGTHAQKDQPQAGHVVMVEGEGWSRAGTFAGVAPDGKAVVHIKDPTPSAPDGNRFYKLPMEHLTDSGETSPMAQGVLKRAKERGLLASEAPAEKPQESQKQKPEAANVKAGQDAGAFKLHGANPFQNDEEEGEAHAAFEHLKNYDIKTKGDLYSALHQHTKNLYEGTDRQLHNITKQYHQHMLQHGGMAGDQKPAEVQKEAPAKEEPKEERSDQVEDLEAAIAAVKKLRRGATVKVNWPPGVAEGQSEATFIDIDSGGHQVIVRGTPPGKKRAAQYTVHVKSVKPVPPVQHPGATVMSGVVDLTPKSPMGADWHYTPEKNGVAARSHKDTDKGQYQVAHNVKDVKHPVRFFPKAKGEASEDLGTASSTQEAQKLVDAHQKPAQKEESKGNATDQLKAHLSGLKGNQRDLFAATVGAFFKNQITKDQLQKRAEQSEAKGQKPLADAIRWLVQHHDKLKEAQSKKQETSGGETRGPVMIGGKQGSRPAQPGARIYWPGDQANAPQKGRIIGVNKNGMAEIQFESSGGERKRTVVPAQLASQWMDHYDKQFGETKKSLAINLDGAVLKALPREKPEAPKPVTGGSNASKVQQGVGSKKPRYTYPAEQGKQKPQAGESSAAPAKPDPVEVPGSPKTADPAALAQQLGLNTPTLQRVAQKFAQTPEMKGRAGFAAFMMTRAKAFAEKHNLDNDYFGLIYDALTKPPQ